MSGRGLSVEHGLAAVAVARSNNAKIGECGTTYAAQASCPTSCVFFEGGGCYAENGRMFSGVTRPLNLVAAAAGLGPVDVALEEAAAIDALEADAIAGRPLRLHTVGDCRTDEAARIVAAAAERYMDRGGGPVWTYTHAWRVVDRESWGRVSVLASCESPEQVELARGRGYATSIVVAEFVKRSLYHLGAGATERVPAAEPGSTSAGVHDVRSPAGTGTSTNTRRRPHRRAWPSLGILPCPAQTTDGVTCSSCRLCMDDGALRERGYSIGFEVHGTASSVRAARRSLETPSDPSRRLTSRDYAVRLRVELGRWPTVRELMGAADVTDSSAREMIDRLRAEPHPTLEPGESQ